MASLPPSTGNFGGPPPGSTPQGLSSVQMDPLQQSSEAPEGGGAGLAKQFYAVEQGLDLLAEVIPQESESIDQIKSLLREVLARAVSSGSGFTGSDQQRGTGVNGPAQEPMI